MNAIIKLRHLDRIILYTIIILAAFPFAQVFYLELGGAILDAFELLYLALIILILFRILARRRIKKTCLPFLLFINMIVLYFFISVNIYGAKSIDFINQLRHYQPFFIGTMLLATGTIVEKEKYLRLLIFASIISSTISLIFHYLTPGFLADLLYRSEELVSLTTIQGRLIWGNAGLTFFVIVVFMLPKKKTTVNKTIMWIAIFLTLVGLASSNNRTMIFALAFLLLGYVFLEKHIMSFIKRSRKAISLGIIAVLIIFILISVSPKIYFLMEKRYLGSGYRFKNVIEQSLIRERIPIYTQYLESIKAYFPLGQGLGKPFHIRRDGTRVPISDISIISFLLPLGLMGLIIFFLFIYSLFRLVSKSKSYIGEKEIRIVKLFLIISLIMSLNIDLFSRNNFVIFLSMFVLTLKNDSSYLRTRIKPRIS